jgi:hypothetical protein
VPGWDLEDVTRGEVDGGSIVHVDAEVPRHHVTEVVDLASGGPDDGFDVLHPPPPRLEDRMADGGVPQLDQFDPGFVDAPNLVRLFEPLSTELHHAILRDGINPLPVDHSGSFGSLRPREQTRITSGRVGWPA